MPRPSRRKSPAGCSEDPWATTSGGLPSRVTLKLGLVHELAGGGAVIATNIWFWVGFIAFVLAMLALDLGVFQRKVHEIKPKEAATWTAVWVGLALIFAGGLWFFSG